MYHFRVISLGSALDTIIFQCLTKNMPIKKPLFFGVIRHKTSAGFTLVELLVVIGVIGVLATGLLVAVNPGAMLARGRDAQRKADMRNIQEALERYASVNSSYPISASWTYSTAAGSSWIPGLDSYMKVVPRDPVNNINGPWTNGRHTYAYISPNGRHYNLVSQLENRSDPDRCELKQWIYVTNYNTGVGNVWCVNGYNYSNFIYSRNSKGNN
jgi:general secretion pathway protein G